MSIEDLKKATLAGRLAYYAGTDKEQAAHLPDLCTCGPASRQFCSCDGPEKRTPQTDEEIVTAMLKVTRPINEPESVLHEADRLVSTDRGSTYGHPLDDFSKVAGMAKALWGRGPESAEEHALYMVLIKLARLQATPGHHDSIVDAAGYLKTYAMVIEERLERLIHRA